jgi:hypothetical protein
VPGLKRIACRFGTDSAPWAFAASFFCLRAGAKDLVLRAHATTGIGDAVSVHRPDLVILAGSHMDETTIARWTYAIERSIGPRPLALYRPATTRTNNPVLPPRRGMRNGSS